MFAIKNRSRRDDKSAANTEISTASESHNLAARMGRWSAAHWKTATFGWLAFVAPKKPPRSRTIRSCSTP